MFSGVVCKKNELSKEKSLVYLNQRISRPERESIFQSVDILEVLGNVIDNTYVLPFLV